MYSFISNFQIIYFDEEYIGTAQFIKRYESELDSHFVVMNGDTLTNLNLSEIIEFHLTKTNIATIFTKKDAIRSGGTYVFDKEVIDYVSTQEDIPDLIQTLMDKKVPLSLYHSDAWYLDIGSKSQLLKAKLLYKSH